jgi:hypothetical protein
MESSMPEESQDEIGTPVEAGEAAIDPSTEVGEVSGQRMAQVRLDMAMGISRVYVLPPSNLGVEEILIMGNSICESSVKPANATRS